MKYFFVQRSRFVWVLLLMQQRPSVSIAMPEERERVVDAVRRNGHLPVAVASNPLLRASRRRIRVKETTTTTESVAALLPSQYIQERQQQQDDGTSRGLKATPTTCTDLCTRKGNIQANKCRRNQKCGQKKAKKQRSICQKACQAGGERKKTKCIKAQKCSNDNTTDPSNTNGGATGAGTVSFCPKLLEPVQCGPVWAWYNGETARGDVYQNRCVARVHGGYAEDDPRCQLCNVDGIPP